jgi:hypothetical protein
LPAAAIFAFVAQSYPQARLAPLNDLFDFARVQAFNSYLCATVHVAHAHSAFTSCARSTVPRTPMSSKC